MTADIAFGQRTVDRIAQRVDADIGVGVTGQAFVVWDLLRRTETRADLPEGRARRIRCRCGA